MDVNPRYAAFLSSYGRNQTFADAKAFTKAHTNAPFMEFIARCKRTAPSDVRADDRIVDQDAFTAHCWSVAQSDLLERFAA